MPTKMCAFLSLLVSRAGCKIRLYRFLIIAVSSNYLAQVTRRHFVWSECVFLTRLLIMSIIYRVPICSDNKSLDILLALEARLLIRSVTTLYTAFPVTVPNDATHKLYDNSQTDIIDIRCLTVRPLKTHISLGIRPVWSESSLCAHYVANDLLFLQADSEDSDQTGRMPSLIWVLAGRTGDCFGFVMRRLIFRFRIVDYNGRQRRWNPAELGLDELKTKIPSFSVHFKQGQHMFICHFGWNPMVLHVFNTIRIVLERTELELLKTITWR